jgi:hypothetical protein
VPLRTAVGPRFYSTRSLCRLLRSLGGYHLIPQSLGCGVEHDLADPPDNERGHRRGRFDGDVEAHPGLVDADRLKVVLDVLSALLECVGGIPNHPGGAPVVLQQMIVDEPEDFDGWPSRDAADRRHTSRAPQSACAPATMSSTRRHPPTPPARTATVIQASPPSMFRGGSSDYQPISPSGVAADGGDPTGPAGVRENRGAGAA